MVVPGQRPMPRLQVPGRRERSLGPAGSKRSPSIGHRGKRVPAESGFTLIELAIVMAVVGIILGGAVQLLGGQLDHQRSKITRERLQIAYDALVAFYATNTYLPCPADGSLERGDPDFGRAQPEGSGACTGGAVAPNERVLPWRTLGLQDEQSYDGWYRRLSYHVSDPLTTAGATGPGTLALRDGAAGTPGSSELSANAAFVILSHGENGLGGWLESGRRMSTTGIPTDEAENADGAEPFVDRPISKVAGDAFDDVTLWREKAALAKSAGAVFSGAICAAADTLWADNGCALGSADDACVAAGAIRSRCG
jgi:prepilin-type N-terminal cleavage/methylation domain-containing protein